MNDNENAFDGDAKNTDVTDKPFPAQITGVVTVDGVNYYQWQELEAGTDSVYVPVQGGRLGTYDGTSGICPTYELNNQMVVVNTEVFLSLRAIAQGDLVYEFAAPGGAGTVSGCPNCSCPGCVGCTGCGWVAGLRNFDCLFISITSVTGACNCPPLPPVTYNCVDGVCTDPHDGSGMYATLADCTATGCAVPPPPPPVTYNCISDVCTEVFDGSGTYTTLGACEVACGIEPIPGTQNCCAGSISCTAGQLLVDGTSGDCSGAGWYAGPQTLGYVSMTGGAIFNGAPAPTPSGIQAYLQCNIGAWSSYISYPTMGAPLIFSGVLVGAVVCNPDSIQLTFIYTLINPPCNGTITIVWELGT